MSPTRLAYVRYTMMAIIQCHCHTPPAYVESVNVATYVYLLCTLFQRYLFFRYTRRCLSSLKARH